jgi:dolichyl-phosphate beta-glucosyltransferase
MSDLSVIIPAYNEEQRLPGTLESVYDYLTAAGRDFEIVVVDDGSHDHTVEVVDDFAREHPRVRVLSYQPNQGKGHALRTGILSAKGELMLIDDADGSSPIEELVRLEAGITSGADVAIGSRAKPDATRKVEALAYRKVIGNTFNAIVQGLLLPGIYDTQCGFKLFKGNVARDIFSASRIDGYGFDVEILYIAKLRGYKIEEVAINWHNVAGSKVNVFIDSPKMLVDVLQIAFGRLFGRYRRLAQRAE